MISNWRAEIEEAIDAFIPAAVLAGSGINREDLEVEFLSAPHRQPSKLPMGQMAVYGFWGNSCWLKIGKVGANSNARFTSQHYLPASSISNLSKSLCNDPARASWPGFDLSKPGDWIKTNTHRVNIYIPVSHPKSVLAFLESFLHLRLKPRYEG